MRLNVGCGADPWGDIRLDVAIQYFGRKSTLNILGDAHHLPFRDKVFSESRMNDVLEHLSSWKHGLKEICRVTKNRIELRFPVNSNRAHPNPDMFNSVFIVSPYYLATLPKRCRGHLWQFTPDVIVKEAKKNGFKANYTIQRKPLFQTFTWKRLRRFFFSRVLNANLVVEYNYLFKIKRETTTKGKLARERKEHHRDACASRIISSF